MKTVRDRLYIEESKKGKYEYLKKEDIFKDKSNKDLFLLAMVIGFKNNLRKELRSRRKSHPLGRRNNLHLHFVTKVHLP